MQTISVTEFKNLVEHNGNNPNLDFINVCTPAEYKEKHIHGVRSVPLDTLEKHAKEFATKQTVYIHCRSGNRGEQAIAKLKSLGVTAELVNVTGGLLAWDEAGLPTGSHTSRLPIMRQTLLAAGVLVLLSVALGTYLHAGWYAVAGFVGLGLSFAGATGWCGMSAFLARMPWNQ